MEESVGSSRVGNRPKAYRDPVGQERRPKTCRYPDGWEVEHRVPQGVGEAFGGLGQATCELGQCLVWPGLC